MVSKAFPVDVAAGRDALSMIEMRDSALTHARILLVDFSVLEDSAIVQCLEKNAQVYLIRDNSIVALSSPSHYSSPSKQ
jgi:hypothetical protein